LVRRTEGNGYGLLPTMQTQGLKVCDENGKTQFFKLPTPRAGNDYRDTKMSPPVNYCK